MGQSILCSYKIPENFDSNYTMTIDGAFSDNRSRSLTLSIEVETNFPIFNNRSAIQADHVIKDVSLNMHRKSEDLI
jgi:hypothetical protein